MAREAQPRIRIMPGPVHPCSAAPQSSYHPIRSARPIGPDATTATAPPACVRFDRSEGLSYTY